MSGALWTAEEIAGATGGRAGGQWSVAGVSIDSRTVLPGELFVALRGPRHDGHHFVRAALDRGAACLIDHLPSGIADTVPHVAVGDTMAALVDLGRAARTRATAKIAAITGSVGKTGTKEALRLCLTGQGRTHASEASHNNHWGVPLSLARTPRTAAFALYELGMSAPGEIRDLARIVRPQVAVITAIAPAHLGNFPSLDAIALAKAEIFQGLERGGTVILNQDSPYFRSLRDLAHAVDCGRVIGFGESEQAAARLVDARLFPDGSDVRMTLDGQSIGYRIGAPGWHWVLNSLAVIATAAAMGADPSKSAAALARFTPPKGRGRRYELPWREGALHLIDESYNANPVSMRAALALLQAAPGRKIAALGDMLELGGETGRFHAELAETIQLSQVDRVFTAGAAMRHLHAALPKELRGVHVDRASALVPILRTELEPGDTLLVKGSLGSAMGQIVEALVTAEENGHSRLKAKG